ncbi:Hypothetical predicted protein [Lecanosticta acicola]|uniref:CFEM domain-containing protein n=1 Tax=Lecanosticta acicola TaxID=111012 RepID=A0AAI8Z3R9_9PEZI|nr:Hypothetical predicted protein [Lecanosticta acicola]
MATLSLFTTVVLLLVLGSWTQATTTDIHVAKRQTEWDLSECATRCLTALIPSSGCEATGLECLCAAQDIQADVTDCVQANCTVIEALETKRVQDTTLCPQPIRNQAGITQDINGALFGIAAAAVVARLLSRLPFVGGSGFGWDDYTILLSLALLVPLDVLLHLMTLHGLGQDIWMVPPSNITTVLYYFWIDEFLYTFILATTKISILLLYIRMWPDTDSQKFRNACLTLIVILATYSITMNVVLAAGCAPISYSWTRWDGQHKGHCISSRAQIFATASLNIIFGLLVFLFPLPKLVKLSFSSTRKKYTLCLTFLVGLVVTICIVVRLQYLTVWGDSANLTRSYNPIAIWSNLECNLSVICACVPALAGLAQRLWAYLFGGSRSSSYGSGSHSDRKYGLRVRSQSSSSWDRQLGGGAHTPTAKKG